MWVTLSNRLGREWSKKQQGDAAHIGLRFLVSYFVCVCMSVCMCLLMLSSPADISLHILQPLIMDLYPEISPGLLSEASRFFNWASIYFPSCPLWDHPYSSCINQSNTFFYSYIHIHLAVILWKALANIQSLHTSSATQFPSHTSSSSYQCADSRLHAATGPHWLELQHREFKVDTEKVCTVDRFGVRSWLLQSLIIWY